MTAPVVNIRTRKPIGPVDPPESPWQQLDKELVALWQTVELLGKACDLLAGSLGIDISRDALDRLPDGNKLLIDGVAPASAETAGGSGIEKAGAGATDGGLDTGDVATEFHDFPHSSVVGSPKANGSASAPAGPEPADGESA